ncbi:hypothetical protein SGLAM104S_01284 [Streptomyces glaucescens]
MGARVAPEAVQAEPRRGHSGADDVEGAGGGVLRGPGGRGLGHGHQDGELTVLVRAASALADQALAAVCAGLALGDDLTFEEHADIAVLVAMAEAAAAGAAQDSTARALDIVGARSTPARLGLDRFWRNARTHTLYEPVAHRLRDVGDYFLNGAHPAFVLPL